MKSTKTDSRKGRGRTSRSPGRASSRSPARKSPGRPRKSPARKSPAGKSSGPPSPAPRSPSRRTAKSPKREPKKSGDAANGLRERKPVADAAPPPPPSARKSTRGTRGAAAYEALLELARSKALPKAKAGLSDDDTASEDEIPARVTRSGTRKLVTPLRPQEVEGPTRLRTAAVVTLVPAMILIVVAVNALCDGQCSFSDPARKLSGLLSLGRWFAPKPAALFASLVAIVTAVSALPCLGARVSSPDSSYVANGWFAAVVTLAAATAVDRLYTPVFEPLTGSWIPLIGPALVFGLALGGILFLLGGRATVAARNEAGDTGVVLHDLVVGRVLNPVILKRLNVKIVLFRIAIISSILLVVAALARGTTVKQLPALSLANVTKLETLKRLATSASASPTLVAFSAMTLIYLWHALLSESSLVYTFEVQTEGTGLATTVGYSLYAFTTPLIAKRILLNDVFLSGVQLGVAAALYAIGFCIYHLSNSQKAAFRRNPLDPKLAHLDSLPTFQGKRLLVGGWWGLVRHPNYLGDIVLHLALGASAYAAPPIVFVALTIALLVCRVSRDDSSCRRRYGAAWERYRGRVPKALIPKIY